MKKKLIAPIGALIATIFTLSCSPDKDSEVIPDQEGPLMVGKKINTTINAVYQDQIPSEVMIDLNEDRLYDFKFEIINLAEYNPSFPYLDSFAVRVVPQGNNKVLDNSGHGYVDALDKGAAVTGNWSTSLGVLSTFNNAGQFKGAGEKYLGVSIASKGKYYNGWLLVNCTADGKTLDIIEYKLNLNESQVKAGE
jgi:hypothetical protein